jgi:Asp/Glu/hydantoin racemase
MPQPRILVVNPNSTEAVTRGVEEALEPLRREGGPRLDCVTLAEGPPGIQSEAHVAEVVAPMAALVAREPHDAVIVACFSDPGLNRLREATAKPVLGIMNAGMTTALNLGNRVGVIAILAASVPRHMRNFRGMGIIDRVAGDRPVGLAVTELSDEGKTLERMIATGRALKDEDGADVIVMGCAGMARYRGRMEAELGVPVVDPTQAAATMALGAVAFGWATRP